MISSFFVRGVLGVGVGAGVVEDDSVVVVVVVVVADSVVVVVVVGVGSEVGDSVVELSPSIEVDEGSCGEVSEEVGVDGF